MEAFDFAAPPTLGGEAVDSLRELLEPAVARSGMLLASMLRVTARAELGEIRRAAGDRLADESNVVFQADTGTVPSSVLVFSAATVVELADVIMGGPGLTTEREPSLLERQLVARRLTSGFVPIADALSALGASGLTLTPVDDTFVIPADLVAIDIELVLGDVTGAGTFAVPASLVGDLDVGSRGAAIDETVNPAVAAALEAVRVPVTIRFDSVRLPAIDVESLEVGDVIRLDHPFGRPVTGMVGEQPWFLGQAGRHGRSLAVKVEHVLENQS